MRSVKLNTTSRLRATPLLQLPDNNIYFYGLWGRVSFPPRNDDRVKSLTQRDIINWPGLSNDYYNNPNQAWAIWVANDISDPFSVDVGTRVRIPSRDHVNEIMATITKDAE